MPYKHLTTMLMSAMILLAAVCIAAAVEASIELFTQPVNEVLNHG